MLRGIRARHASCLASRHQCLCLAGPVVARDAAPDSELVFKRADLRFRQGGDLGVTADAEAVENAFELRADAGNRLEVVAGLRGRFWGSDLRRGCSFGLALRRLRTIR